MVREGYKKTVIGHIPIEWELKQIGDVIKFSGGAQPPKETFINEPKEGYIRLIQIRDYKTDSYKTYIPKELVKKVCSKDDIMIGRYGPPIFQILKGLEGAYNVALIKAIPSKEILNKEYARIFLSTEKLFKLIDRLSQRTSGQTGIDMEALNNYFIPIPKLKEQEKIAEILSTLDCQIDDTDKLIEKTKELKKGLMQKFLTKGIGHTEFKKTEVGEIPVEWKVRDIIDIADTTSGGTPNRSKNYYYENGDICWIKTGELNNKYIYNTEEKITKEAIKESSAKLIPMNSVIFAMYGATIGKMSINKVITTTNQACCSIICKKELMNYEFLYYYLSFIKDKLIYLGAGGAQPNISQNIIKKFKVILPQIDEQKKIANILSSVDTQIEEYENKKSKLEHLKKGLMQQLLTGKIRVKI